ncbi:MAG: hypothetical protein IMZ55_02855 [Acidobacteria bacterium]|nr:hypothetical protein [Acidobacteriota bacterium]
MRVTWNRSFGLVFAFIMVLAPLALAQEAPKPNLTFDADAGIILLYVKADRTAEFEEMMAKMKEGMGKLDAPEVKQQAAGFRILKAPNGPAPAGAVLYVMLADPAVKNVEYAFLPILYKAFPAEAKAFSDKWAEIKHTHPAVIWKDLQLVVKMQ